MYLMSHISGQNPLFMSGSECEGLGAWVGRSCPRFWSYTHELKLGTLELSIVLNSHSFLDKLQTLCMFDACLPALPGLPGHTRTWPGDPNSLSSPVLFISHFPSLVYSTVDAVVLLSHSMKSYWCGLHGQWLISVPMHNNGIATKRACCKEIRI